MIKQLEIQFKEKLFFIASSLFLVLVEVFFWSQLAILLGSEDLNFSQNFLDLLNRIGLVNIFIFTVILRFMLNNFHVWLIHHIGFGFLKKLRNDLGHSLINSNFESYEKIGKGRYTSNIVTNSGIYVDSILLNKMKIFTDFLQLLSVTFAVIIVSGIQSLIIIVTLLIIAFIGIFSLRNLFKKWSATIVDLTNKLNKSTDYLLFALKEIKVNNFGDEIKKFNSAIYSKISRTQIFIRFTQISPRFAVETLFYLFIGFYMMKIFSAGSDNAISLAALSFYLVAGMRVMPLINQMMIAYNGVRAGEGPARQLEIDLSLLHEDDNQSHIKSLDNSENVLICKNIAYSYSKKEVISNLSCEFSTGDIVHISGKSGSGKTTAVDLFLGLRKPSKGKIYKRKNLDSFYVSQHPFFPSANIEDYFKTLNPTVVWEDISQILISLGLKDLSQNQDYYLGEGGSNLSGGQRQLLSLCAAIIVKPKILVLDETTSGLDAKSEKIFLDYVSKYFSESLVLFISHRESSATICNKKLKFPL